MLGDTMLAHVHIGAQKTGSTSIQVFLHENRAALARLGVLYPLSVTDNAVQGLGLPLMCSHNPLAHVPLPSLFPVLKSELQRSALPRVIISAENLHGELRTPQRVAELREFLRALGCREVYIIVYLREQGALQASWDSQIIRHGDRKTNAPFMPEHSPYVAAALDHATALQRWAAIFGEDSLRVRLFEREAWAGGDLILDFLQAADLSCQEDFVRTEPVNESLNLLERELHLALNRIIPGRSFMPDNLKYNIMQHLQPAMAALAADRTLRYSPPRSPRNAGGNATRRAMRRCAPATSRIGSICSPRAPTRWRTAAWVRCQTGTGRPWPEPSPRWQNMMPGSRVNCGGCAASWRGCGRKGTGTDMQEYARKVMSTPT